MREGERSAGGTPPSGRTAARDRGMTTARIVLAVLAAAVIAFAIGYLINWGRVQSGDRTVGELRQELAVTRLQARMGSAVVEASRSNYEAARQDMVAVFQEMQSRRNEVDPALGRRFDQALAERDEIVTLLSRASPEANGRLVLMYSRTWEGGNDAVAPGG
jgi:hypothetical protein